MSTPSPQVGVASVTADGPSHRAGAGLERIPADVDPRKIAELLDRDGGVIVEDVVDRPTLARLDAELEPHIVRRPPGFREGFDDTFYGANTVRIQGLPRKCPSFVPELLLHPTLLGIADAMLLDNCGDYWMSQGETIYIGPGNPAQELHRDDLNWGPAAKLGIDLQVSVLLALGDYDAEVGATMVVPGSHRWPLDRPFDAPMALPVEMEPGDALIYVGSLVHGGGHNRTPDRWRRAVYLAYLVGWLTPEEAVSVSVGPDFAATLPQRAKELLGWANVATPGGDSSAAEALQLWQLDLDDLDDLGGTFVHR